MKIGFIGVGKLGKEAAEVMAETHDVLGYDVKQVEPENFEMVSTIEEVCKDRELIFIAVPHHIIQIMMVDIQHHTYQIKILITQSLTMY